MNLKGIIVEQIDWEGTSKSLTMQTDYRLGDLWVAFPHDYISARTGPFYFQNSDYEKKYKANFAECQAREISKENFYQTDQVFTFKTAWHNIPTENNALTYYALYLPEYAIPIRINLFDPQKLEKKYNRTVIKDDQKPRYIIYLQCSSKFGSFNFNVECQFKKDQEQFFVNNYTDEYQIDLYSPPDQWKYLMNENDREKTQKFFAEQIIINKGKLKQSFKPNQPQEKKKFKLEFIHWFTIISTICAIIVLFFGNNLWGRKNFDKNTNVKSDSSNTNLNQKTKDSTKDNTIRTLNLPTGIIENKTAQTNKFQFANNNKLTKVSFFQEANKSVSIDGFHKSKENQEEIEEHAKPGSLSLFSIYGSKYTYTGEIKNGKANGYGEALFDSNTKQVGYFKDNQRQGTFSFLDSVNKRLFTAFYRNDSIITVSNLEIYYSNFHGFYTGEVDENIIPHGQGKLLLDTGYFVGRFENGRLREGKALFPLARKNTSIYQLEDPHGMLSYEGDVYGFEPQGKGILRYKDGDYYEGGFDRGLFNGEGLLYENGKITRGTWDHGTYQKQKR